MKILTAPNAKFQSIQALRLIAALLVVLCHSTFYVHERLNSGVAVWGPGATGVNIFFVISGFVMMVSSQRLIGAEDDWKLFIIRRAKRIYPMYWLATTIKLLVLVALPVTVLHSNPSFFEGVLSYLLLPSFNIEYEVKPVLAVGWTLLFEMFFYAMFAAALYFRRNLLITLGLLFFGLTAVSVFRTAQWPAVAAYASPLLLQFYFGILIAAAVLRGVRPVPILSIPLIGGGFALLLFPKSLDLLPSLGGALPLLTRFGPEWGHHDYNIAYVLATGIPSAMIVFGCTGLERRLNGRIPRSILVLGDASYVLYLFHPLIAPAIPMALSKLGFTNGAVSVIGCIAVALAFSVAIHLCIERPLNNALKGRKPSQQHGQSFAAER